MFVIKSGTLQLLLNQVFIAGTGRTEFRLCHVFAEITQRDRIGILSPPRISRTVFVITSGALQLLLNQVFIAGTGRTEFRLCHVLAEITQKRDRIGILSSRT